MSKKFGITLEWDDISESRLNLLCQRTGLNRVDVFKYALAVYDLLTEQKALGKIPAIVCGGDDSQGPLEYREIELSDPIKNTEKETAEWLRKVE